MSSISLYFSLSLFISEGYGKKERFLQNVIKRSDYILSQSVLLLNFFMSIVWISVCWKEWIEQVLINHCASIALHLMKRILKLKYYFIFLEITLVWKDGWRWWQINFINKGKGLTFISAKLFLFHTWKNYVMIFLIIFCLLFSYFFWTPWNLKIINLPFPSSCLFTFFLKKKYSYYYYSIICYIYSIV